VRLVLYPLSAFRAMSAAALKIYQALRFDGTQRNVMELMQTRKEMYQYLSYETFEQVLDRIFQQER
jgi:methylisocitrate lyase